MKNILTLITLYFTEDYMKTYMKTNELVKILAAFFLSAAALCASDYYFGTSSGDYVSSGSWFVDESRTQPASGVPNQYKDTAVFYETSASAYITQYDMYVGNVVFAGSSSIKFGNQLPKPDNYTAYFDAGGKSQPRYAEIRLPQFSELHSTPRKARLESTLHSAG